MIPLTPVAPFISNVLSMVTEADISEFGDTRRLKVLPLETVALIPINIGLPVVFWYVVLKALLLVMSCHV